MEEVIEDEQDNNYEENEEDRRREILKNYKRMKIMRGPHWKYILKR